MPYVYGSTLSMCTKHTSTKENDLSENEKKSAINVEEVRCVQAEHPSQCLNEYKRVTMRSTFEKTTRTARITHHLFVCTDQKVKIELEW